MLMPCAISCATMSLSIWQMTMLFRHRRDRFLKQGKASCGVARQYTGSAGKIANARSACSPPMFRVMACVHRRALYLSKEWTDDPDRLKHVRASDTALRPTKACDENDRTRDSRVCTFKWVAADTVYGVGDIEQQLRHAAKAMCSDQQRSCVQFLGKRRSVSGTAAKSPRPTFIRLETLSAGTNQRPRLHDWCYLELADLDAAQFNSANDGL